MASTPLRPKDRRILNVGTWTGPPNGTPFAGDSFLAGKSYATGCSGSKATNPGVPSSNWSVGPGVVEEPDGTIKSYFLQSGETVIDNYCRNDGITESKYQALVDANNDAYKNYCDNAVGGIHYLKDPNCGYVREVSRSIGVDVWDPLPPAPDPEDEPDCEIAGKLLSTVTVTGTATGTGYGVGPYSINSDVGLIAVHAGLINVGDTAKIRLKSHDQDKVANFPGSTRNGVTTFDSSGTVEGIIESVTIVDPGSLGSNSTNVQPLSVNGENAELLVKLNNSLQVVGVTVYNGGQNYKVGDTFEVTSLGFGPGVSTPALLQVSAVRSATAGGGACAVDLELEELLTEKPDECEPEFEQKSITVDGNNAALRGPINGLRVKNPFANPNKVVDSLSETDSDYNWYESCPPVPDGEQEYIGQYTFSLTNDSPSFTEDHTEAKFTYNFTRYFDMTSGCCPGSGGGTITGVRIKDAGARNTKDPVINPDNVNGDGASFNITLDSEGTLTNVAIINGGLGYKVGDTFRVTSTYVFNFPDDAIVEVTSVTPNQACQNSNRINWKVNSVKVDTDGGGDGFAVGDKFELKPKFGTDAYDDGYTNINAIIEVINIEGQIVSGGTINYIIEKDAQLVYTDTTKNKTIDLVRDYLPDTTTDEILINTADTVFVWCLENIFRPPTDIEFQYWIRQIYPQGGEMTPEIDTDMTAYFGTETQTTGQVQQILSSCDTQVPVGEGRPVEEADAGADGTDCRWSRDNFFVPSQTAATNMKVKELWDFYGRPRGPSGPGGGTSTDGFSNPRPEDDVGLLQDNEADLSDLAGLKVWRWVPCTDGSNGGDALLGSYIEDTVPIPGIAENCNNQTVEDQYAIYDKDSKVYYVNNTSSVTNLVRQTKTQQALQVNQMYLDPVTGVGRPAGQIGMNYWLGEIAVDKVQDRHATYWNRSKVVWSGGKETEGVYVDQTKTNLANAVNDEYLDIVGRPAEQLGLDYWVKEAERDGLDSMLVNLRAGLQLEVETEGRATEFVYGYDRMLEHLAYSLLYGDEKTRGGVRDIKTYCEYQTTDSLDVSWFHDTRPPPWFGSVGFDGDVTLTPTVIGDNIYFKNFPQTQGDTKSTFASPDSTANHKIEFNNQYVCSWPTIKGQPAQGQPMPILVRYVNITWYSYDNTNGEVYKFELQDYNNDLLETYVGPRVLQYTPVVNGQSVDDMAGTFNLNNPDPTLQTIDLMLTDFKIRKFVSGPGSGFVPLSADIANELSWDESPKFKYKMYPTVRAEALLMNPDTGELVPVGTRSDTLKLDSDTQANRFFSAWGECTQCSDGTVACPPNTCPSTTCPDGSSPPCGPTGSCNPFVTCQSGNSLQVLTNQPTTLTFRFDVNTNYCSTQGTAKISIRRWWPCPIFGPASPQYNAWMKDAQGNEIIKRSVQVVDGTATYELPVNTSKDDYLAVSYEDQFYDDPGSCHWYYTAYWEYSHPNATCNQGAWENPGCDTGSGTSQLPEVLCIQKENCSAADDYQPSGLITVASGKVKNYEILNPYPDGSLVNIIPNVEGYPSAGQNNPAVLDAGSDYNWYYDCMPTANPIIDSQGDSIPNETYSWVSVTGSGSGFWGLFNFYRYQELTYGPDGTVFMTKGCEDSGGDFTQWYVARKSYTESSSGIPGIDSQGDGYKVGDILEYRAINQDPDTRPVRIRITEIESTGVKTDCSNAPWANEFTIFEMDPDLDCLPYCSTSDKLTFYWKDQPSGPQPGVNCSTGTGIAGSLGLAANQNCNDDCPACEQTFFVQVGETTECGPIVQKPGMTEGPYSPGINSGRFRTSGVSFIATPNFFPTVWSVNDISRKTDTDGEDYVNMLLESWINIPGVGYDTLFTKGVDRAIDWEQGNNDEALSDGWQCGTIGEPGSYSCVKSGLGQYQESWIEFDGTPGSNGLVFDCDPWKYAPDPTCAPGGAVDVDCSAKVRTIGQWWYKYFYKNKTESEFFPLNQYSIYNNVSIRKKVYEVPEGYWPEANTAANAFQFEYGGESGNFSYFTNSTSRPVPIGTRDGGKDKGIASVGIYLSAAASNDEFGNEKYQNPPPGYKAKFFGTDVTIDSPRPPWAIGTSGIPGPKDEIFLVGKFSVNPPADFPTANWTGDRIDGCEDAQVYDKYDFWAEGGLVCGEQGQPGSYSCIRSGLGQYQESWTNYDGTTGGSLRYGCDPWKNAPDPNCAPPLSSVVLQANNDDGGIFAADWKGEAPSNCGEGLRIIWYLDGVIRSGDYELDPGNRLSCGESTQDFSQWATDSNKTYTAEYIIVDNNIGAGTGNNGLPTQRIAEKYVNFDWTSVYNDPDAKPYAYSDVRAWTLKRGTRGRPLEITTKQDGSPLTDGDLWQVILGGASCTFQGNDGGGDKDLTGLKNPDFDIVSSDETWNGSNNNLPCYTAAERDCCNPVYAANNPTNRCEEEIIGVIYNCCDDNFGNGKLTARVNNANTAWPNIPGTQEKVVGTISYLWEKQGNNSTWSAVPGGTGATITYTADGSRYRCTVTFDLTGKVPSGYTAKPIKTTTTKVFQASDEQTEVCPDGTVVAVGTPCPNTLPCSQPTFLDTSEPEIYILTGSVQSGFNKATYANPALGETVTMIVTGLWSGFFSSKLKYLRATAQLRESAVGPAVQTIDLVPSTDPNQKIQDDIFFTGGFQVSSATATTKNYQVTFTIYYQCEGSASTQVSWGMSNICKVQWGSTQEPYMSGAAQCYNAPVYQNAAGCGSWLAQWVFPANPSASGLYFMTPGSDVRGPKWNTNNALKGNCTACPAVSQDCPTIDIKNVIANTLTINTKITLQVVFELDMKGYTPKGQPTVIWTDEGQVFPNNGVYATQVQVGPFTTPGTRKIQVAVSQQFNDPDRKCPLTGAGLTIYEFMNDVLVYDLNIGGEPPPPPSEKPVITGSITGTSTVNLVGGTGTGLYTLDYDINPGQGYQEADRPINVGWDGAPTRAEQFDYQRTFTQAGNYNVVAKISKLYAKPGYTGPLDTQSIIDAGMQYWAVTSNETNPRIDPYPVRVNAETAVVEPSTTMTLTGDDRGDLGTSGSVTLNFRAVARFDGGTYNASPEPSVLRYDMEGSPLSGGTREYNITEKSWSRTFTSPGTYRIGARAQKNWCPPDVAVDSNCAGKEGAFDFDSINVTITEPPKGSTPDAYAGLVTYNKTCLGLFLSGCGCAQFATDRVEAKLSIEVTEGTGIYDWDQVTTTTGNWTWTGSRLELTAIRPIGEYNWGTIVIFKKNGQEVYRKGVSGSYCVQLDPLGPIGPINL